LESDSNVNVLIFPPTPAVVAFSSLISLLS
jgi:hypothetical protein